MNILTKKFIAPGAWFSLMYPGEWNEFEDTEGSFLFYNPDKWTGNFRISAFKADPKLPGANRYGKEAVQYEQEQNHSAVSVWVGTLQTAYSKEMFQENGEYYVTHVWIGGVDNLAFECSFTVFKGGEIAMAEQVIASLEVREEEKNYPTEIIPIRVLEINSVNEQHEWATNEVKKQLKKDFTAEKSDLSKLQQLIDGDRFKPQQREVWECFGVAFATILTHEIDGMEWVTVIDGHREYPAVRYKESALRVDPHRLIADKKKRGESCLLEREFENIVAVIEKEYL